MEERIENLEHEVLRLDSCVRRLVNIILSKEEGYQPDVHKILEDVFREKGAHGELL